MKFILELEIEDGQFDLDIMGWVVELKDTATDYGKITRCELVDIPNNNKMDLSK